MISTATVQAIVKNVTYKPGWEFTAYEGRYLGPHVFIHAKVIDSTDHSKMTDLEIHCHVPRTVDTSEQFLAWLLDRLIEAEIHEACEFLRYQGYLIKDPHEKGSDRDL